MDTVKKALKPAQLYYLAIDGTAALDSAIFGSLLEEHRGWSNLAAEYLDPAAEDGTRLVDPAHPFLPIHTDHGEDVRIAVVTPSGLNGLGEEKFWPDYEERQDGVLLQGMGAAAEASARYMSQLILRPSIHFSRESNGLIAHFADLHRPNAGAAAPTADILYVSCHGWMGGFMRGGAPPTAPDGKDLYPPPSSYFAVGHAASRGDGFHGPKWIVLAQCSTLNSATWTLWAKVLAASSPGVRGILAYGEAAPYPLEASLIAKRFFARLDANVPFLQAWREANGRHKWAAIVHHEATGDTLADFRPEWPLSSVATTTSTASYRGYTSETRGGRDILDVPEPFTLVLEREEGGLFRPILPENVHQIGLQAKGHYRMTLTASAGALIERARVRLVHIRPTYTPSFTWAQIFSTVMNRQSLDIRDHGTQTLELRAKTPAPTLCFDLRAADAPAGLATGGGHSYFWVRVELRTDTGTLKRDFQTNGLRY